MSLTFKQFVKEVAEPKAGDEKRFKDKHVVQAIDHPLNDKETLNGTKKSPSKAKRKADYEKDEDAYVYEEMMKCPHCDEEYEKGKRHNCDMKEDDDEEEMEESKKEDDPPFTGGHKARTYKDRFGNVVKTKNIAKHLAKKELAKQKEKVKEEMTPAQEKKREEIVQSMKDDEEGLKKRYGDKWRSVMYATATKKAMEEGAELDEISTKTLRSYSKKAKKELDQYGDQGDWGLDDLHPDDERHRTKRYLGYARADYIRAKRARAARQKVKESSELDETILDYDNFVGKGKEMWKVTWSGSSGRGAGGLKRTTGMSGIPVGSSEDDVKKIWQKKNKDKKFISAKKVGIREEVELDEAEIKYVIKHKKTKQVLSTHDNYNDAKDEHNGISDKQNYGIFKQTKKDASLANRNTMREFVELGEVFKAGSMKLNDGSSVNLSSDDATALNELFKSLNSNNKSKMEQILNQSKKGYNEILSFAKAM